MEFLIFIAIAVAVAAAVFFVIKKKQSGSSSSGGLISQYVPTPDFAFSYSPGMSGNARVFGFPAKDGVHGVTKAAPKLSVGQEITLEFAISGAGTLAAVEGGVARCGLFMQRAGDNMLGTGAFQQYRYYAIAGVVLDHAGDYSVKAKLVPEQWSDVFGKPGTDFPDNFKACVENASVIGFVFGQMGAGWAHGVFANGQVGFTLKKFEVA